MEISSAAITLVGVIATVGTVSFGIPQAIKVTKDRSAEGVSRATWWLALAICWPWGAYGFSANDLFLFITNILAGAVAIWVLVVCDRSRWPLILLSTLSASVAGVAAMLVSPIALLVITATVMLIASRVPQLVLLLRIKTARDVSLVTWLLSLVTGGSWTVYGLLQGDAVIYTANGIATAMTMAIIVRLLYLQNSRGRVSSVVEETLASGDSAHENPNTEKY